MLGIETVTLLALEMVPGIGNCTLSNIIRISSLRGISSADVIASSKEELLEVFQLSEKVIDKWLSEKDVYLRKAEELELFLKLNNVHVVINLDILYPQIFESFFSSPPALLFMYGNRNLLRCRRFSVLCSRNPAEEHLEKLREVVVINASKGEVLVTSSVAEGYSESYVAALKYGFPKILVLDTGFFRALGVDLSNEVSSISRKWREEFDSKQDLAISEHSPYRQYKRGANYRRDKMVAALSDSINFLHVKKGGNMERLYNKSLQFKEKDIFIDP